MAWTHRQPELKRSAWPSAKVMVDTAGFAGLLVLVAASAVITKELNTHSPAQPLAVVTDQTGGLDRPLDEAASAGVGRVVEVADPLSPPAQAVEFHTPSVPDDAQADLSIRYFNGRAVRPVRKVWMTVTAYSPDWRSCGDSADNITASNHHVYTNAHRLAAADTRVLPLGSMISIPGYDREQIVPVLDRGGAIKGYRLDVLFPTHEQARAWGVRKVPVTVWGYADDKPADDYRKIRDSKR
jgi:3D (Asp-Asp-Asp) domain-containing protein